MFDSRISRAASAALIAFAALGGDDRAEAAGVASAVVTETVAKGPERPLFTRTTFSALAGESNRLTVARDGSSTLFAEASLAVAAGAGCTQRGPSSASCPGEYISVDLGDGDDRADDAVSDRVDGGAGDDVLTGVGTMTGGPGVDKLTGKPVLSPPRFPSINYEIPLFVDGGGGERDTYTGAPGNDIVSYRGRATPVRIDLTRDTNEDHFVAIHSITGGEADDVIVGDSQPNNLDGGKGRDRLLGGDGNDRLTGDGRGDSLTGGPGDDTLELAGARDRLSCGPGTDLLTAYWGFGASVRVPADCERAGFGRAYTLRGSPTRRGRFVSVRVDEVAQKGEVVALFGGRRLLGHSRDVNRRGTYRIKLNRAGLRLARRGRAIDVRPSVYPSRSSQDPNGYRYELR